MPKSKQRKQVTDRRASGNRLQSMMQEAGRVDTRRQKQISNQGESITRLLKRFDDAQTLTEPDVGQEMPTSHAAYDEEMAILHMGFAGAQAADEEARAALRGLVDALENTWKGDAALGASVIKALSDAQRCIEQGGLV